MTSFEANADWRSFMRRHWGAVALFVVAGVLAVAGAVYVFLWFVREAQASGLIPSSLALWSLNTLVSFLLYAIFWELLLVGVPVAVAFALGWLFWWRGLPYAERSSYSHFFGRGSKKSTGGGGGLSLLFFIAFCIKVYLDGNWNSPIASWTLDYLVNSTVLILAWGAVIFGIPLAIGVTWWLAHELRKPAPL